MDLVHVAVSLAAEPASIFYMVTGAVGFLFARRRTSSKPAESSVAMLFCRRATHERLSQISLT
jgi:hypothetical protein